ncbi:MULTISPECIES: homocysteine biosynthesis protein [Aphanothece]|uniref:homocysteine biosynthesis protein n=1 Tax=Aphanothece TaxID=1121 RepID=UPI003984852B
MTPPPRSEAGLRQRQERGELRVLTAAHYRALVAREGLAAAYAATDVVVAADAGFTDQASLQLSLGPCDPPIRLRTVQLGGVNGLASGGSGELVLPIGGAATEREGPSGARLLGALLAGRSVPLAAGGEATPLHPRRELHTDLSLERIAAGRLLLHRAIGENGIVAVSSAPELCHSPLGPLLGPFTTALYSCGGPGSIGLTMPGLHLLGPGSPVLVGGAIGWVIGSGSGHQPEPRRQPSGHARTPGAVAAVAVDLHGLDGRWLRPCFFEGHGHALLVAIAAPVPLLDPTVARQAAAGPEQLEAPVLDLAIPRRVKPSLGTASYADLLHGDLTVGGRSLRCAPAHSPRLAQEVAEDLVQRLSSGTFPLRLPGLPLGGRPALVPLDP